MLGRIGSTLLWPGAVHGSFRSMQTAIDESVAMDLTRQGYAVFDGALGSAIASAHRNEIDMLQRSGMLHKNSTHLVSASGTELLEKTHILEGEVTHDSQLAAECPHISSHSQDPTIRTMLSVFLPHLTLGSQATKVQYNSGTSFNTFSIVYEC